jgi:hypothetical protein
VLSIDIMDISGEHQNDLTHDIEKTRISKEGDIIDLHGTGQSRVLLPSLQPFDSILNNIG